MSVRLATISPSFGTYGGILAVQLAVAEALAGSVFDPVVVLKRVRGTDTSPELLRVLRSSGLRWCVVDPASRELARVVRSSDAVHLHTPSVDVAALALALGRPYALMVHNHRKAHERARNARVRAVVAGAAAVWCNSAFVRSSWGFDDRVRQVPTVAWDPSAPEAAVDPAARRGFVLVARFIENKGIEELVEAYAAADLDRGAHPLVLVGDGPLRTRVERLVARHRLGEHVRTPGFVPESSRKDLVASARWLVAPSNTGEDLGLTPLEARMLGVPCIVTRDGGLPEAGGATAIRCSPGSVGELRRALERGAAMDDDAYAATCAASRAELRTSLRPMSDYVALFQGLVGA